MDLELLPGWTTDDHNVIVSWSGKTQIEDNVRSTLFEEGRQRIRAIAERCVTGVIENEDVEGLTLKFGKVAAHLSRPQDAKFVVVVHPGLDDDVGGYPNGLGGTQEQERSGNDLQDCDCNEEVHAFQGTASPAKLSRFIEDLSRPRDSIHGRTASQARCLTKRGNRT